MPFICIYLLFIDINVCVNEWHVWAWVHCVDTVLNTRALLGNVLRCIAAFIRRWNQDICLWATTMCFCTFDLWCVTVVCVTSAFFCNVSKVSFDKLTAIHALSQWNNMHLCPGNLKELRCVWRMLLNTDFSVSEAAIVWVVVVVPWCHPRCYTDENTYNSDIPRNHCHGYRTSSSNKLCMSAITKVPNPQIILHDTVRTELTQQTQLCCTTIEWLHALYRRQKTFHRVSSSVIRSSNHFLSTADVSMLRAAEQFVRVRIG